MATIPDALALALQHHQAGRLTEAEALYRKILQAQPNHADALHLLGVMAHQAGKHEMAVEYIVRAIALQPTAEYHNNMGTVYRAMGKLDDAVAQYRQALVCRPAYVQAAYNLGTVLKAQGKPTEAEPLYRQALALKSDDAQICCKLGDVLKAQGKLEEAVAQYRQALALNAGLLEGHNNLGVALAEQGKFGDAEACYRQALALQPACAEVRNNLANALREQGRPREAIVEFRHALALKPDCAEACYNLGLTLGEQGDLHEAVALCRQALALKPDYDDAENRLMYYVQHLGEWKDLEALIARQKQRLQAQPAPRLSPFTFLAIPTSAAEQWTCARNWAATFAPYALQRDQMGFCFTRTPKLRLRVGYLSSDYYEHATAYLMTELFELHDRARVDVTAYSYGKDDGGAMRQRLVAGCDRFVDVQGASFQEAARQIYEDRIDILVDLKGYTKGARTGILALRPAPIQVNYLGYPGTMGADFVDYLITDRFITPPERAPFFSEQLVYLPDCYQINDRQRPLAAQTPTRAACGLPAKGFVFGCFNSTYKITSEVFAVWMRVLGTVPSAVLWLYEGNRVVMANLRGEAQARGIDPARLVFARPLPRDQHLARVRCADLLLDTLPVNGHTTASDALWAGLPVLTCVGETLVSRVAGSLLTAIGLPELITTSLADYEALAVRLARRPDQLAGLRRRLARNRLTAPLFDSERFTRHIERAYRLMWERYVSGEAPQAIEVPALSLAKKRPVKRCPTGPV